MGKIILGDSKYGKVVAILDGDKLVQGDSKYGKVIARVNGDKIIQGDSKYGKVVGRVTEGGLMSASVGAVYITLM